LTMYGRTDVALALAQQVTYPSWGYMIHPATAETPATTLWELGDTDVEGDSMNSRNHIMFGSVGGWFHTALAGLKHDNDAAGFTHIKIIPQIYSTTMPLLYVDDSLNTIRGEVRVSWQITNGSGICGSAPENNVLTLTCPVGTDTINKIVFASFGTPTGSCPNLATGSCDSSNSVSILSSACLGKTSCSVNASDTIFGDPCYGTVKRMVLQATCNGTGGGSGTPSTVPIFVLAAIDANTKTQKVLLINKKNYPACINVPGAASKTIYILDESSGMGPARKAMTTSDTITLQPFAVAVIRW